MAELGKRLPNNAPGEFFVDSTCINCDTCRQLAPLTFAEEDDYSYVRAQPEDKDGRASAFRALVAGPTASIGAGSPAEVRQAAAEFPLEIESRVFYCGYASEKSFGGSSYFVSDPEGNWLIDSPRYTRQLVRRFEEMGGVRRIFLTHRDDVADAARYAERFRSERIIHKLELSAQPEAERVIEGFEPVALEAGFVAIPTPGHTRGHTALLYAGRYLFSGDHLWWSRPKGRLNASRNVCWYSWPQQTRSMEWLASYRFEWVLPGHGERAQLPQEEMRRQIVSLARQMAA